MAARRYRYWNGEVLRNDLYFMETMIAKDDAADTRKRHTNCFRNACAAFRRS
jgi:hypothetical protein